MLLTSPSLSSPASRTLSHHSALSANEEEEDTRNPAEFLSTAPHHRPLQQESEEVVASAAAGVGAQERIHALTAQIAMPPPTQTQFSTLGETQSSREEIEGGTLTSHNTDTQYPPALVTPLQHSLQKLHTPHTPDDRDNLGDIPLSNTEISNAGLKDPSHTHSFEDFHSCRDTPSGALSCTLPLTPSLSSIKKCFSQEKQASHTYTPSAQCSYTLFCSVAQRLNHHSLSHQPMELTPQHICPSFIRTLFWQSPLYKTSNTNHNYLCSDDTNEEMHVSDVHCADEKRKMQLNITISFSRISHLCFFLALSLLRNHHQRMIHHLLHITFHRLTISLQIPLHIFLQMHFLCTQQTFSLSLHILFSICSSFLTYFCYFLPSSGCVGGGHNHCPAFEGEYAPMCGLTAIDYSAKSHSGAAHHGTKHTHTPHQHTEQKQHNGK